jgi:tetratricopeptide (TPR) repeat protein
VSVYSNPKNSTSAVFNVADLAETALAVRKSEVLAIDARRTGSPQLLGTIADQIGRHDGAIEIILSTIALNNRAASYHSNLGTVFQAQGKLDEAEACYERALALKPGLAEARSNLGNILQAQGKLDEAVACYERALALKFELAETRSNLGNILQAQGKLDEAVACYERALALKPDCAPAHYNLGYALRALGNLDEALVRYRRALALQPDYAKARFAESLAQLFKGDFAAGWHNYESRWQSKDHNTQARNYPQPLWTGEKLASGRLLIWGEQGVGDEIMFTGLIPDVIRTGNRCMLDCDARLKPLFARSFPDIDVVSGHDPGHDPELDIAAHLPSGSLPGLFRSTNAAFASTTSPYLIADSVQRERFRARYADGRRLVGLAWQTNNRKTGHSRSNDLSWFAPLFARTDIRWISLQYGDYDVLEAQAAAASAPILIDRSVNQLSDIDTFAAQIAALDLVVTIDNSTAHLAGALGVPTWVLLPFAPDWRWLQIGEDSLWYPTMRLFRQLKLGDWQSVVQRVHNVL